ncbi:MAG: hypothetical protein AAF492_17450, partial [Verrucomicrobiota bacterium]
MWSDPIEIVPEELQAYSMFGLKVDVQEDRIVIGSYLVDPAFVIERENEVWRGPVRLSGDYSGADFYPSVTINPDQIIMASTFGDGLSGPGQGHVASWENQTASGGTLTFHDSFNPSENAGEFIIQRTWTATDEAGNLSSDVQLITMALLNGEDDLTDSDGDGVPDVIEITRGTDPHDVDDHGPRTCDQVARAFSYAKLRAELEESNQHCLPPETLEYDYEDSDVFDVGELEDCACLLTIRVQGRLSNSKGESGTILESASLLEDTQPDFKGLIEPWGDYNSPDGTCSMFTLDQWVYWTVTGHEEFKLEYNSNSAAHRDNDAHVKIDSVWGDVIDVDLDTDANDDSSINRDDEDPEEDPGVRVCLNVDDDDGDGQHDMDQEPIQPGTPSVLGEDDLMKIKLDYNRYPSWIDEVQNTLVAEILELQVEFAGTGDIRLWKSADKNEEIEYAEDDDPGDNRERLEWELHEGEIPPTYIYVEGIARSAYEDDVILTLRQTVTASSGFLGVPPVVCEDYIL